MRFFTIQSGTRMTNIVKKQGSEMPEKVFNTNIQGGKSMVRKALMIVAICVIICSSTTFAAVADLPQTGQTTCYDSSGAVVDCPTAGIGQDGALRKGVPWPSPRFTITGTGDACVLDNLTGLMWMRNMPGSTYTWQDALNYANGRNGANLCGFNSGWRLPNINELYSLLNEATWPPTTYLQTWFGTIYNEAWSSTTFLGAPTSAWTLPFNSGYDQQRPKGSPSAYYVLPVRGPDTPGPAPVWKTGQTTCWDGSGNPVDPCAGGQDGHVQAGVAWPAPRFTVDGDCVIDNLTDLMWVGAPNAAQTSWQGALNDANSRSTCGFFDWRLPNLVELRSLFNYGEADISTWLNGQGFTGVPSGGTWSSTTYGGNLSHSRITTIIWGTTSYYGKTNPWLFAWAVRDLSAPDISLSPGALDFGDVLYSLTSPIQTITITNTGTADLVISTIEVTGTSPAMFAAVQGATNGCAIPNATVIPGASCTLDVTFTPTAFDLQEALLYINSNDPDTPRVQVSLSGNGVQFLYAPLEGTIGTEITILGLEFGDKKGKVLIGTAATKVTSWTNTRITATVKKVPLPVGPYEVSFSTKLATVTLPDDFTVKNPELDPLTDDNKSGFPEEEIVLTGRFFGTKKGKVYLEYTDSKGQAKKKSCKISYWYMNPTTGVSELKFFVPKLSKSFTTGLHPLRVENKIGFAIASEDFIVGDL